MSGWRGRTSGQTVDAYNAMPEPDEDRLQYATHILSEWLNDRAPLGEQRYREPARALLKFNAWVEKEDKP